MNEHLFSKIRSILERWERDGRGGKVPGQEVLFDDDAGPEPPDESFLLERIEGRDPEKFEETYRRALVDLLRSDVPLSRDTRDIRRTTWSGCGGQTPRPTSAAAVCLRRW